MFIWVVVGDIECRCTHVYHNHVCASYSLCACARFLGVFAHTLYRGRARGLQRFRRPAPFPAAAAVVVVAGGLGAATMAAIPEEETMLSLATIAAMAAAMLTSPYLLRRQRVKKGSFQAVAAR